MSGQEITMDYEGHALRMSAALVLISEHARYWMNREPEHAHMLTEILGTTKSGLAPYVAERRANGTLAPAAA